MKVVKKAKISSKKQYEHAITERNVLVIVIEYIF